MNHLLKKEIIPIYKPKNWPSFKVVKILRKLTNIKKIGYLGTLDPQAEGLLVVGIGKGTKKLNFLPQEKEYIAEIAFGIETETWDLESEKIKIFGYQKIKKSLLKRKLKEFEGKHYQVIPLYSAKKFKGEKLYEIARKGGKIKELPQKQIEILKISLLEFKNKKIKIKDKEIILPVVTLKIKCKKGTFIRSLAYELGEKLKTKATLVKLKRTKEGGFSIKQAIKIENIK